jgi:hypothetical protein
VIVDVRADEVSAEGFRVHWTTDRAENAHLWLYKGAELVGDAGAIAPVPPATPTEGFFRFHDLLPSTEYRVVVAGVDRDHQRELTVRTAQV